MLGKWMFWKEKTEGGDFHLSKISQETEGIMIWPGSG